MRYDAESRLGTVAMVKLFEVSVFGCVGLGTVDVFSRFLLQCVFARAS